jgi:S-(hydroxymethyl)glutathione dehydrogenase/alcohol dehydrogenase
MSVLSRAVIADGVGGYQISTTEVQDPEADEVLVRMEAAGLCHTDHDSLSWNRPMVIGHEGAGIVYKTGSSVNDLKKGDRVILNWAMPCYHCFQCMEGNQHLCENNSPVVGGKNGYSAGHAHPEGTRWNNVPIERSFNLGTLSEFALVKSAALVKNTCEKLGSASASIISCGVMTGYGSAVNAARVKAGSSVVVLGTGGVGLNVIQGARICGAARIIAVDIKKERLEMALRFGATHCIQADPDDTGLQQAALEVKSLTKGRGADYAFECTARPELGAAPLLMVRNAGTAIQVSGIEQVISIDMNLFEWDKIYLNPLYGKCRPQIDFPRIIDLYEAGKLLLDEMVTRTYALEDIGSAFKDMLEGRNAKGVIVFN